MRLGSRAMSTSAQFALMLELCAQVWGEETALTSQNDTLDDNIRSRSVLHHISTLPSPQSRAWLGLSLYHDREEIIYISWGGCKTQEPAFISPIYILLFLFLLHDTLKRSNTSSDRKYSLQHTIDCSIWNSSIFSHWCPFIHLFDITFPSARVLKTQEKTSAVPYRRNLNKWNSCFVSECEQHFDSSPLFARRVKVFRGRKVHGEFDIKVEQVGITCDYLLYFIYNSYFLPTREACHNSSFYWWICFPGLTWDLSFEEDLMPLIYW